MSIGTEHETDNDMTVSELFEAWLTSEKKLHGRNAPKHLP